MKNSNQRLKVCLVDARHRLGVAGQKEFESDPIYVHAGNKVSYSEITQHVRGSIIDIGVDEAVDQYDFKFK